MYDEFLRASKEATSEACVVLEICEWSLNDVMKLSPLHSREFWTALPKPWAVTLGRFPLDVRREILKSYVHFFPRDLLEESLQGLDKGSGEYLSIVAFSAFANNNRDVNLREDFAIALQLGRTTALPLFREWAQKLKEMASADGLERENMRERLVELLYQIMPSVEKANPILNGLVEDVVNVHVPCDNETKLTALHIAAKSGDLDLLSSLLACHAKFDTRDNDGNTALHFGVDHHPGIFNALLSAAEGAHKLDLFVQQVNDQGETALHLCTNAESARSLLRVTPNLLFAMDTWSSTALHSSVDSPGVVEVLLAAVGDEQKRRKFVHLSTFTGQTALHCCRNAESARLLLHASPGLVFSTDEEGNTALHLAVEHPGIVQLLLDAARNGGDARQLKQFLCQANEEGKTALHLCQNTESARLLLAASPNLTSIKCNEGYTPLHIHAMSGLEDICRLELESYSADVNAINAKRQTPLHLACRFRRAEIVRLLLKHFPNLLARDSERRTVLHYALTNSGYDDVVDYPITNFPEQGDYQQARLILDLFLKQGGAAHAVAELVAACDMRIMTALHYCTAFNAEGFELADKLMVAGTDATVQDNEGNTAMHLAVYYGAPMLLYLVKHWGMSIQVKNNAGETALDRVRDAKPRAELLRASALARAVTLLLATRPKSAQCPWKRFPRELFGELCSFLV